MDGLRNIREFVKKTILMEYGTKKWSIYQTTIVGINPQHKVIDKAYSKEEADKKVSGLEMKDPSGIYYSERDSAVKLKHSFELN